jgi:NAD(P)-dependent dehydrogenase (short-subunit alcohol dehydrogenase family)
MDAPSPLPSQKKARVVILYLEEHDDARETQQLVEKHGRRCLILDGDVGDSTFCTQAVDRALGEFGHLDVLVNNAAEQHPLRSTRSRTSSSSVRSEPTCSRTST